jgi:hypothetical protein
MAGRSIFDPLVPAGAYDGARGAGRFLLLSGRGGGGRHQPAARKSLTRATYGDLS